MMRQATPPVEKLPPAAPAAPSARTEPPLVERIALKAMGLVGVLTPESEKIRPAEIPGVAVGAGREFVKAAQMAPHYPGPPLGLPKAKERVLGAAGFAGTQAGSIAQLAAGGVFQPWGESAAAAGAWLSRGGAYQAAKAAMGEVLANRFVRTLSQAPPAFILSAYEEFHQNGFHPVRILKAGGVGAATVMAFQGALETAGAAGGVAAKALRPIPKGKALPVESPVDLTQPAPLRVGKAQEAAVVEPATIPAGKPAAPQVAPVAAPAAPVAPRARVQKAGGAKVQAKVEVAASDYLVTRTQEVADDLLSRQPKTTVGEILRSGFSTMTKAPVRSGRAIADALAGLGYVLEGGRRPGEILKMQVRKAEVAPVAPIKPPAKPAGATVEGKQPWEMPETQFAANPPSGFEYVPGRPFAARRQQAGNPGLTRISDGFFRLSPDAKSGLIYHEEGHDLVSPLVGHEQSLIEDFRVGEAAGARTQYEGGWDFRPQPPEEIVAEAYATLREGTYKGFLFREDGSRVPKYDKLFRAVAGEAIKQGKPVPPSVLADYPDLAKPAPTVGKAPVAAPKVGGAKVVPKVVKGATLNIIPPPEGPVKLTPVALPAEVLHLTRPEEKVGAGERAARATANLVQVAAKPSGRLADLAYTVDREALKEWGETFDVPSPPWITGENVTAFHQRILKKLADPSKRTLPELKADFEHITNRKVTGNPTKERMIQVVGRLQDHAVGIEVRRVLGEAGYRLDKRIFVSYGIPSKGRWKGGEFGPSPDYSVGAGIENARRTGAARAMNEGQDLGWDREDPFAQGPEAGEKPYYAAAGGPGRTPTTPPVVGHQKTVPPGGATGKVEFPKEGNRALGGVYEKEIGPKLITGGLRKWLGVFSSAIPPRGRVRVRTLADLRVLGHETGHFLDWITGGFKAPKGSIYREELKALTREVNPFEETFKHWVDATGKPHRRQTGYTAYRYKSAELYADYMATYVQDPEAAARLAPNFTKFIEDHIASKSDQGQAIRYVVDRLREFNNEFQPLKDYVDGLRQIPELQTTLATFEPKGNPLGMLWRRVVGDRLWRGIQRGFQRFGRTKVGEVVTEQKGLPQGVFQILQSRRKLIDGQQARIHDTLTEPLRKLTPEDQTAVADALQRFEALSADNPLRGITETTKGELALWGNEARKLGLLNDATFWSNVGQYFPFFYTTKEFAFNAERLGPPFPGKALRANLSSFKHRLSDVEMGQKTLEAQLGTWPSSKAKIAKYTEEQLAAIGKNAREEMGLIHTATYPVTRRLDLMVQSVYTTKALNAIAKAPGMVGSANMEGYVRLPEGKSLGDLSGQWVPRTVAGEINSWSRNVDTLGRVWDAVNSAWKTAKVPMDPAATFRNFVTNLGQMWMDDVPVGNPRVTLGGLRSFATRDATYQVLRDHGLYRHTYGVEELKSLASLAETDPTNAFGVIVKWAAKAAKTPGEFYGRVEDACKTIIAKDAMSRGASPQQAVARADKILFDYGQVSPLVGVARRGPLPFVTWSAKVLPRLVETAVRRPEKYLFVYGALAVAGAVARRTLHVTRAEEEAYKPEYLEGKTKAVVMLPFRDKNGDLKWVDLTYFAPWGGWTETMKGSVVPQPMQASGPLLALYNAYGQGYDPFVGQIAPSYMTEAEKTTAKREYVKRSLLPNVLGGYSSKRIIQAVKGEKDYYGRKPSLPLAVARSTVGLSVVSGGPLTTGATKFTQRMADLRKETRRPLVQGFVDAVKARDRKTIAATWDKIVALPEADREAVSDSILRLLTAQASPYPALEKMPRGEITAYGAFLSALKQTHRARAKPTQPQSTR